MDYIEAHTIQTAHSKIHFHKYSVSTFQKLPCSLTGSDNHVFIGAPGELSFFLTAEIQSYVSPTALYINSLGKNISDRSTYDDTRLEFVEIHWNAQKDSLLPI